MSRLTFQEAKLLFTVTILSCASCNVQSNRCEARVSHCNSIVVQCNSLVESNDSTIKSCDSTKVCCDSINSIRSKFISEQDVISTMNASTDSIINIISHFKRVECELPDNISHDTTIVNTNKVLPRKYNEVLRYILLDEDNYKTNEIIYGIFSPSIKYKLYLSKQKYIYAEFDFGLRKWQIIDIYNKVLFQGDIKENNLQMLRFSRLVFPKDMTLKIIQDNLKSL